MHDAATGAFVEALFNPTPETDDHFGGVVAANDDYIVVGAKGDNTMGTSAGAAYVYDAYTLQLLHTLFAPAAAANDEFGTSVALRGRNVIVGAPFSDLDGPANGAAFSFDAETGNYQTTYHNPSPDNGDLFGMAVAAKGNEVIIGAPRGDEMRLRGAAYVFDLKTADLLLEFSSPGSFCDRRIWQDCGIHWDRYRDRSALRSPAGKSGGSCLLV